MASIKEYNSTEVRRKIHVGLLRLSAYVDFMESTQNIVPTADIVGLEYRKFRTFLLVGNDQIESVNVPQITFETSSGLCGLHCLDDGQLEQVHGWLVVLLDTVRNAIRPGKIAAWVTPSEFFAWSNTPDGREHCSGVAFVAKTTEATNPNIITNNLICAERFVICERGQEVMAVVEKLSD